MLKLSLEGIDFTEHHRRFREPILAALRWIVTSPQYRNFKFELLNRPMVQPAAAVSGKVAMDYLKFICDFLETEPSPLPPDQILELIRQDQVFRATYGWKRLNHWISPLTRTPTDMIASRNLLRKIFSYEVFSAGHGLHWDDQAFTLSEVNLASESPWGASQFIQAVQNANHLSYCPYCNAEAVYAVELVEGDGRWIRTSLDHFFPRWKYPYLALEPYNLVPACDRCNSRCKHERDVLDHSQPYRKGTWAKNDSAIATPKLKIVYPYGDSLHDGARFEVSNPSPEWFAGSANADSLKLECQTSPTEDGRRYAESVLLYRLRTVYQRIYGRELAELPLRLRVAQSAYPEILSNALKRWGGAPGNVSAHAIRRFLLNGTLNATRINDERLGKLKCDIYEQLGRG